MRKGSLMKYKGIVALTVSALLFCGVIQEAQAASSQGTKNVYTQKKKKEKNDKPKSIWDDESAANPYFKKQKSAKKDTKKTVKEERAKTPSKRRAYTGPSKKEIAQAATQKAEENFKSFFSSEEYNVEYGQISYDVTGDSLSVNDVTVVPNKDQSEQNAIPYLMKADQIILIRFNVGEKDGRPMRDKGEMLVRKLEFPIWNEKAVKKGKVEIDHLKMGGDMATFLKAKGEGKIASVEIRNLRSEAIINETVLNNVVRSKVLSASSAYFTDAALQKSILESLKQQKLDGVNFASATINGRSLASLDAARAVMTSYSARILNTDLVLGARLEAKKEKPEPFPDVELLKKNVTENKAAIAATEEELKEKTKEPHNG